MDHRVDPCKDFYNFACGQYVKSNRIPDDKYKISYFQYINDFIYRQMRVILEQESLEKETHTTKVAKNLYKSCLNSDLQPLMGLLAEFGGWPVVEGPTWNDSRFSMTRVLLMYHKLNMLSNYWFSIDILQHTESQRLINIMMNRPSLSPRYFISGISYYDDSDDSIKFSAALLFGADSSTAMEDMYELVLFKNELAIIVKDEQNETPNSYTIQEWQELIPEISWLELFSHLLPSYINNAKIKISAKPDYFKSLSMLLKKYSIRTLSNYMLWNFVSEFAEYLSEDFRQLFFYHKDNDDKFGVISTTPRWEFCVKFLQTKLPYGYGSLYVKNYFYMNVETQVNKRLEHLQKSFHKIIQSSNWMSETKLKVLEKFNAISFNISFREEFSNDSYLDELHKKIPADEPSFLLNILSVGDFPLTENDFWNPAEANSHYSYYVNTLAIYAGIIQGIFFNPDSPKFANFAGLGFIIGHEIAHGFDDKGIKIDGQGNQANWLPNETAVKYGEKQLCLIKQYNQYAMTEKNTKTEESGIRSLSENIADNGGVKLAYLAYQQWVQDNHPEPGLPGLPYSPNQLFWISYAQKFCTKYRKEYWHNSNSYANDRFRIIGPLSNSPDFSKDFNCPLGSGMNPTKKCNF